MARVTTDQSRQKIPLNCQLFAKRRKLGLGLGEDGLLRRQVCAGYLAEVQLLLYDALCFGLDTDYFFIRGDLVPKGLLINK